MKNIRSVFIVFLLIASQFFACNAQEYTSTSLRPYNTSTAKNISLQRLNKKRAESPYPYESNQTPTINNTTDDQSTWYSRNEPTHGYNQRD